MNALTATSLLLQLLTQATALGNLIRTAQSEGRDITAAELDALAADDDAARARLQSAIDAAL